MIGMPVQQLLARLLAVATLLVAALAFAPAGAQAHAGHTHGAQPTVQVVEPVIEPAAVVQHVEIERATAQAEVTSGRAASLQPASGHETSRCCPNGCCHSMGAGCCPVWLPAAPEIPAPALRRPALVATVTGGAGVKPGALPEPPKALV
jgi:hypothetical protein